MTNKEERKSLALYVAEQLSPLENTRHIPMMGGWLFYYREKIIGGIYGDGFAVKDTPTSREYMPDSACIKWELTPQNLLPCTVLDDSEKLCEMVEKMYPELPEPKKKKTSKKKSFPENKQK